MIVDASAMVAIMHREAGSDGLLDRLLAARQRFTHPVSIYEASLAIARLKGGEPGFGRSEVDDFCADVALGSIDLGPREAAAALEAFSRYGRGRHPAALNMGDCFSYACAKLKGVPLLYKGHDFARTDLA